MSRRSSGALPATLALRREAEDLLLPAVDVDEVLRGWRQRRSRS